MFDSAKNKEGEWVNINIQAKYDGNGNYHMKIDDNEYVGKVVINGTDKFWHIKEKKAKKIKKKYEKTANSVSSDMDEMIKATINTCLSDAT